MKYVIVDLEMNPVSNEYPNERKVSRLETIQIGAVLLDEKYQEIGSFVTLVKPEYNTRIQKRYEKLTGIKTSMVESAPHFKEALGMFFNWCGSIQDEVQILMEQSGFGAMKDVKAVISADDLARMQREVSEIFVHETVCRYIVDLVNATRSHELVSLGLSTRGAIAVTRMAKASAYMKDRTFVLPQDVAEVFPAAAVHRLKCSARAKLSQGDQRQIIGEILKSVRQPRPER